MLSMQMEKESMQNRKPMILVLAGPNGSGKSTITTFFDKVGKYTNADDVVATTGMDNMKAALMVDRMRYESIDKKQGISQTQFANAIGVETSTISRIETGKSDPSAVTLFAIAKYLQVSVDDLYTRKTAEQIKNEREQEFFKRNIRYYVSTFESGKNC